MDNRSKEYRFLWFIENYSYCMHKNEEFLNSPQFIADSLDDTAWYLRLYPRGYAEKDRDNIFIFLVRSEKDAGPENFQLNYELSVLATDGSSLYSGGGEMTFQKGGGYGYHKLLPMDEVLLLRKADYLPQDTLSVCCKIWKGDGISKDQENKQSVIEISAQTRIGIEQISFLHKTESFNALQPNEKKIVQMTSSSDKNPVLTSSLYYTDDSWCDGKIIVEITPVDTDQILSRCKLSLLDESGKLIQCGKADNRFDAARKDIRQLPLTLIRQVILDRKDKYLPDDKLTLLCACIFSKGVEYERIVKTLHEMPSEAVDQVRDFCQEEDAYNAAAKLSACPSAIDDLKNIYFNQQLTDVELKTKTKSFPAHKIVLCARSSILNAMLTNDMREKSTNCIQVEDLENDTVQQFLLFLYSDRLENLEWKSAINLYYAGDKYAVEKLKVMCASFLVDNLSISTASELLLLADTHNDKDLKKVVEDFILDQEEKVFGSDEWEKLIETNPLLVIKTMHLKYRRNKLH